MYHLTNINKMFCPFLCDIIKMIIEFEWRRMMFFSEFIVFIKLSLSESIKIIIFEFVMIRLIEFDVIC